MSSILIVDDMPAIRAALARILTEHQMDFDPILEAATGEEAVQLALQYQPDIVLMDIKMPALNGLQATARIRKQLPNIKIIMLTAYNEFSYVQKALKLGARDYLLKPVRPDKLAALLEDVQEEIRLEKRDMRTVKIVKDSLQKTMPVIETNLVENLIRGAIPEGGAVAESLAYLGKRLRWPVVLVAKIDNYGDFMQKRPPAARQKIQVDLVNQMRQQVPEPQRTLVGYSHPGRVVLIVSTDQHLITTQKLYTFADNLRHSIAQKSPFSVTIGIGNQYVEMDSIPLSYAEANLARRYQSQQQGNRVIHINDVPTLASDGNSARAFPVQRERQLVQSVQTNQPQRAHQLTNEIVDYLAQHYNAEPEAIKNHCTELVTLVAWGVIKAGAVEHQVLETLHQQVRALSAWKSVADVRRWTLNSIAEMFAIVQHLSQEQDAVQQAVEYIHQNFHRSDISLQEIAERVNLSVSHLSTQFKSKMGMSYVKYLTSVRLQEAQKLLLTSDETVTEIAALVGYPNATNFYRHFRKQFQTTPGAYRQEKS
jgi:two-component system response regulator YesN